METTTTNYSMYTEAANRDVAKAVDVLIERIRIGDVIRNNLPAEVRTMCDRIARTWGEVYDTEPQEEIADVLSAVCAEQGWLPISRWDW